MLDAMGLYSCVLLIDIYQCTFNCSCKVNLLPKVAIDQTPTNLRCNDTSTLRAILEIHSYSAVCPCEQQHFQGIPLSTESVYTHMLLFFSHDLQLFTCMGMWHLPNLQILTEDKSSNCRFEQQQQCSYDVATDKMCLREDDFVMSSIRLQPNAGTQCQQTLFGGRLSAIIFSAALTAGRIEWIVTATSHMCHVLKENHCNF